jgi:hypothetical protein
LTMARWTILTVPQKREVVDVAKKCGCLENINSVTTIVSEVPKLSMPTGGNNIHGLLLALFAQIDGQKAWSDFIDVVGLYEDEDTITYKEFVAVIKRLGLLTITSRASNIHRQLPKDQFYFLDLRSHVQTLRNTMRDDTGLIGLSIPHDEDRVLDALTCRMLEHPTLRASAHSVNGKPRYRIEDYSPWAEYRGEVAKNLLRSGHRIIQVIPKDEPEKIWEDIQAMPHNVSENGRKIVILAGNCLKDKEITACVPLPSIKIDQTDIEEWLTDAFAYKESCGWCSVEFNYIESIAQHIINNTHAQSRFVSNVYQTLHDLSNAFGADTFEDFAAEVKDFLV